MFTLESEMQALIHKEPDIVLSGIPEINPEYCPDTPNIISLGREIPLNSGPIDNIFIDTNAIITLVECKLYSNSNIKREVYAQAINYASDLRVMLSHYNSDEFIDEFFSIIKRGQNCDIRSFDSIIDTLSKDEILTRKKVDEWKKQFLQRLEANIKAGVFRIIIACAPHISNQFAYSPIRNLIQLMNFSESLDSKYDLILMDIRESSQKYDSKIIWRRYAQLPQIPLIAKAYRDKNVQVEKMQTIFNALPEEKKELFNILREKLMTKKIHLKEQSTGFGLYRDNKSKSLYISIDIDKKGFIIRKHQIRKNEKLFHLIKDNKIQEMLSPISYELIDKKTTAGADMYEIQIKDITIEKLDLLVEKISEFLAYVRLLDS